MSETLTTNYSLVKPEVGVVGATQWSVRLNEDLDDIDAIMQDFQDQLDVLAPDAPETLTERLEALERMLSGKRKLRRIETTTSVTVDLDEVADALWITKTGSGGAFITLTAPTPDQESVDGTADGTFTMQEGYIILQNLGSAVVGFAAINMSVSWIDGDGGGISAQSCPAGALRFYKYIIFASTGSSETPPSNRLYLFRTAL